MEVKAVGIFSRKKPAIGGGSPASASIVAQPISVNPTLKAQALRHAHRVHTIYLAIEQAPASLGPGTTVESLKDELQRRHGALIFHGHQAPVSKEEAQALVEKLGGSV